MSSTTVNPDCSGRPILQTHLEIDAPPWHFKTSYITCVRRSYPLPNLDVKDYLLMTMAPLCYGPSSDFRISYIGKAKACKAQCKLSLLGQHRPTRLTRHRTHVSLGLVPRQGF
jgi:hypothetical protein